MKSSTQLYDVTTARLIEASDSLDELRLIRGSWFFRDVGNSVVICHDRNIRRFTFPFYDNVNSVTCAAEAMTVLVCTSTRLCLWSFHQTDYNYSLWYFQMPELGRLCRSFPAKPQDSFKQFGGRYESNASISSDGTWCMLHISGGGRDREHALIKIELSTGRVVRVLQSQRDVAIGCMCLTCKDSILLARRTETSGCESLGIWNAHSGALVEVCAFDAGITAICDFRRYPLLFLGTSDGRVILFDVHTRNVVFELNCVNEPVLNLQISSDHLRLIVNGAFIFRIYWSYDF